MASLALHLGLLTTPAWRPGWDSAEQTDGDRPLQARVLAPAAAVQPAPPPKPAPKRKRPALPAAGVAGAPEAPAAPVDSVSDSAPAALPLETPTVVAAPAAVPAAEAGAAVGPLTLPRQVRIHYLVMLNDGGFIAGDSQHNLDHDGGTYTLRSTARTTGLAALFKPVTVVHASAGSIVDGGLRPLSFRIERNGTAGDSASFDWESSRVNLSNGNSFELGRGAQDMLSLFCQLSVVPIDGNVIAIPVVTGKKLESYEFAVVGEESISLPIGRRRALHLRTLNNSGREATEIWLDLDAHRLPVRIRHVDRRGDAFDQLADRLEIDGKVEGAP